jgi:hypothetical protein
MNPERILVHSVSPIYRRQFNLCVARALDLQEEGHEVAVSYCDEKSGTCSANLIGSPLACLSCRRAARQSIQSAGLAALPIHRESNAPIVVAASLETKKELATAVFSNLVTQLRMMPGEINRTAACRLIKRRYFHTAMGLLRAYDKLVSRWKPDRIEVLNGRHACSKYALTVAAQRNIPFNVLEYTLRKLPIVFKGHLPHDRVAFQDRLKALPADEAVAEQYYSGRRSAVYNKFAKQHLRFDPDPKASRYKSRVTFFLSSQDECASLGPQWRNPFPDEATVVRAACERFPDTFFSVRFHPHQAGMPGDVVKPFAPLAHCENLQIYRPESKVNTYELVQWSDCVVTFASTVAIEACWMGKPAIQLGPSFYDRLGISYTPATMDAFLELLSRDTLEPGNRANAARFAYFELHDSDEIRHLEIEGRRNRIRGCKPRLWLGARFSKQVNNLARDLIKTYHRIAG